MRAAAARLGDQHGLLATVAERPQRLLVAERVPDAACHQPDPLDRLAGTAPGRPGRVDDARGRARRCRQQSAQLDQIAWTSEPGGED